MDLSFLSNCESTSFISEPKTLKELFISARDFLNSRSPSRPIFKLKFSDILRHHLGMEIKKEPCGSGRYRKRSSRGGYSFSALNCSINGNLLIYTFDDWLNAFFICPVAFMIPSCHQCFFPYFVISWIFLCNRLSK